jgi:hypothetical protein
MNVTYVLANVTNTTSSQQVVHWLFTRTDEFTKLDYYCVAATIAALVTYHITAETNRTSDRYGRDVTSFEGMVDAGMLSWVKNATRDKSQRVIVVQCLRTSGMVVQIFVAVCLVGAVAAAKNSMEHHHWPHRARHFAPCMFFTAATVYFGIVMMAYFFFSVSLLAHRVRASRLKPTRGKRWWRWSGVRRGGEFRAPCCKWDTG